MLGVHSRTMKMILIFVALCAMLSAPCDFLSKREAEVHRIAFEKEKELTDRALKLAEAGKPKSIWELQGLLGLAAFVLGFLVGK